MAQNTTLGAQALLHVVHLKRKEVVALLLKHGVVVKPSASDLEIAKAVTDLCKISKSFYQAFMQLMADKTVVTSVYSSMDGYSNAGGSFYTPTNFNIGNTTTSTTDSFCDKPENKSLGLCSGTSGASSTTSSTTSSGGGSKWLTQGLNVLQTAFNGYLQLDENKTKRELANASVQVAQAGGNVNGGTNTPPPSSNTTLYVVLGILGVSVIGLVVYLATKKKA
jgi:hypothetical protein